MSEFSTVLSRFVKEKDVNVYRLAKYCGYDRANLYKVMRGERKPPSLEVLNLLCEYMHLSPAEEEILEENYEITMVGHDNYYRRKNVMKFFSDFSMTSNLENVLPTVELKRILKFQIQVICCFAAIMKLILRFFILLQMKQKIKKDIFRYWHSRNMRWEICWQCVEILQTK